MSLPILSKVLARAQSSLFGSWVPFAVLTLVLTALIALRGWSSYDEQTNTAQNQVKNITFVLAIELNRSLDGISRSLDFIVSQIKPDAMVAESKSHYQNEINKLLVQQVKLNSLPVGIRIFDARGDLIYSAVPNESSINVSHREYFNYLRQHPGETYFSPTTLIGGLSGVPVLPIARAIHSSSGAFLGVVITTLPIKSLKEVFEELEVGSGGTVSLRTIGSGALIYRYPDNGEQTNHQLPNTPMEKMVASGIEDGTATYTTASDGVKRLYSFRVLDTPFPYSIYVGLAESDYLASWRKNMVFTIFGALVLDAFVGFFFFRQRQAYKKLNRNLKALELSQASLKLSELVIANTNDAVVITQADPREQAGGPPIVFVNEAYTRETGYLAEEVIGRSPAILQGPKTDRATLDRIRAAIEQWQPVREEVLNYKKNGEEFWVDLEIIPIADETGWFTHWVSIQRNITERKLNEKILAEANHHLELAVRAGSVGIWEWDLVNNVLVFDEQMYRLYGISGDQFGGAYEAWQAALHPDDLEWADLEIQNVLAGLKEYNVKYRVLWPDGSIHYIHALGYVERDDSDKPIRMSGTNWDITEQKEAENRAEELAFFDHLTSLANRRLFADRLQRALKLSERSKQYCALLSIDIDHFKSINDLHGHDGGDLVLQATAQHLLKVVRTGDTVARMGGDEFVILLEDLGSNPLEASSAAKTIAEKILAKFNGLDKLTSSIPMCSLSIGTTAFIGGPVDSNGIMKQSDLALYQAKEAGRNCMRFYDEQMQASINARTSLEATLHQAIENEWFVLHYQPQIVGNQRIESAEVLLRLDHPQRGLINPGEFIDLAESTGLILPIGQWVLNAACQQLAAWASQDNMAHLALSVNISIKQFAQANFVSQIIDTVVRTGANPKLITLELTESLFLVDTTDAIQKMQALKDYGFNFSLDDFGTGYSSLSYLKSLPFDELKIDQAFVAETPGNQVGNDIVRAIILMGQTLGLKVVAEGVESKDQLEYLQSIGCQYYQGYLFFHPMPADELVLAITH
jgi:diguanylate cyclase (GGDEF)-like protein/PAS domain S-box-containing protein